MISEGMKLIYKISTVRKYHQEAINVCRCNLVTPFDHIVELVVESYSSLNLELRLDCSFHGGGTHLP